MDERIKTILVKGLLEGYGGRITFKTVERAGFEGESSDYQGPEGRYHDEWFAHQNGGGQELGESTDGEKATRVYAGGSLDDESLRKLGLTGKDVTGKLVFFINKLGDKTRLDQNASDTDGKWSYAYRILKRVKEIPVEVGEEEIRYHGELVFVHYHINSPVR